MNFTNTYLSNTIELTDKKARYDNCAKAIMADKQVLARIAKHTTKEFKGYDIPTIIQRIRSGWYDFSSRGSKSLENVNRRIPTAIR